LLFLSLPLRNLGRRPLRSVLTSLGVGMAVATLIALVGMSRGVENSWTQSLAQRGIHMVAIRKGTVDLMGSTVDQKLVDRIAQVEGVQAVAGELGDMVHLEAGVILVGGWALEGFLWETLRLQQGRYPRPGETHGVVVGRRLAERLGLKLGDTLAFLGTELKVLGISHQTGALVESVLIVPLPLLQKLLAKEGRVTLIQIRLAHPDDAPWVAELHKRLHQLFPDLMFFETKELAEANQVLRLLRSLNWGISFIALLMGLFFVLNTLLMSVTERARELGILGAVGWGRGRILVMVMLEGMFLAALGSALGVALGFFGLHWLSSLKNLQGIIDPVVSWRFLLEIFGAATLLGVLGSLYPAWRTTRLRTVEALKYE